MFDQTYVPRGIRLFGGYHRDFFFTEAHCADNEPDEIENIDDYNDLEGFEVPDDVPVDAEDPPNMHRILDSRRRLDSETESVDNNQPSTSSADQPSTSSNDSTGILVNFDKRIHL